MRYLTFQDQLKEAARLNAKLGLCGKSAGQCDPDELKLKHAEELVPLCVRVYDENPQLNEEHIIQEVLADYREAAEKEEVPDEQE